MSDHRDNIKTLVVTTTDNYLVLVGDPSYISGERLKELILQGYKIETMLFKEFVALNLTWIYDKPKLKYISIRITDILKARQC